MGCVAPRTGVSVLPRIWGKERVGISGSPALKQGPEEVVVFSTSVADWVMFGVFGAETLLAV